VKPIGLVQGARAVGLEAEEGLDGKEALEGGIAAVAGLTGMPQGLGNQRLGQDDVVGIAVVEERAFDLAAVVPEGRMAVNEDVVGGDAGARPELRAGGRLDVQFSAVGPEQPAFRRQAGEHRGAGRRAGRVDQEAVRVDDPHDGEAVAGAIGQEGPYSTRGQAVVRCGELLGIG